jgi:hypothetical protein
MTAVRLSGGYEIPYSYKLFFFYFGYTVLLNLTFASLLLLSQQFNITCITLSIIITNITYNSTIGVAQCV